MKLLHNIYYFMFFYIDTPEIIDCAALREIKDKS